MSSRAALPDLNALNQDALKALILVQQEEILLQREQLQTKDEQLAWRQAEIERLQLLIAKLRRMQFGRRSEKLNRQIEQLELQAWTSCKRRRRRPGLILHRERRPGRPRRERSPCGGHCRLTCRARCERFCPRKQRVRTAVAS